MKNFLMPFAVLLFFGTMVSFFEPGLRGSVFPILAFISCLAIYFVPIIVALTRDHPARVSILLLNLFLGWTLLGWVGALVWAAMPIKQRHLTLMEQALIERNIADQLRF